MKSPKISVIIPIYNVEDYLEETLNSLFNQSIIDDIEVLMIDDGSTDDSRYIIEKYALDYENFHAFHKQNEGLPFTRNFGIEHAKGDYIHFFDSDDVIVNDGYEKLYNMAIKNDSDIVTSDFTKFSRYNSWKDILSKNAFKNIDGDVDSTTLNNHVELVWDAITTNKLYKREFLNKNNIRFPNKRIVYEDNTFSLKAYILANKISISHDIFYFWRMRFRKNTSITQKGSNIQNFLDRVEIVEMMEHILEENQVSDRIKNASYKKWLNHDYFLFLKKFYIFPDDYSYDLLKNINKILKIIPYEIRNDLNSFKKILYKMVENSDISGLNYISCLNNELMENPQLPPKLDSQYIELIDFINDASLEDLVVKSQDMVEYDEDNIYVKFTESINYLSPDHSHNFKAYLVNSKNEERSLKLTDNIIIVPIDVIKNEGHITIKLEYISDEFSKKNYLQGTRRQVISYDGFDVEIGIESNRIFCIDTRLTNDNEIEITDLTFESDVLYFEGTSDEKIDEIYLENVVTFKRLYYSVESVKEEGKFTIKFSIPHMDFLKYPVDKWEIRVSNVFKSIKIPRRFEFYTHFNKIRIINARNKILIENDLYDKFDKLYENYEEIYQLKNIKRDLTRENKKLKRQNKNLIDKNKRLEEKNEWLGEIIDDYKSRFVVKSIDKVKKIIKK